MKEALPEIPLQRDGEPAIPVQISKPLAMHAIVKMTEGPVEHITVPVEISGFAGQSPCEQGRNECLIVRPPEFHIVPVFLDGTVVDIPEIQQASEFRIPAATPHAVQHVTTQSGEVAVVAASSLLQHKPCTLNGVPGIQQSAIEVVGNAAVRQYCLHHTAQGRLEEQFCDFLNAAVDPHSQLADVGRSPSQFLSGGDGDHSRSKPQQRAFVGQFRGHFARRKVHVDKPREQFPRQICGLTISGDLSMSCEGNGRK